MNITIIKKYILPVLIVILIAVTACAIYFYTKANPKTSSETVSQSDDQMILDRVKKLILLPEGEVPTIATVSNLEKLKGQAFFDKAKIGDRVLMYIKAQKAYLYDQVNNRILEVAPISLENTAPTPPPQPTATPISTPKSKVIPRPKK